MIQATQVIVIQRIYSANSQFAEMIEWFLKAR
jgi:hypothetical protein